MSDRDEKVEETLHFGEYLKEARLLKGLSVRDVCHETKLSRHMVESIEAGNRSILPEDVYLKSFVRTMAFACGADPEKALELLLKQTPPTKERLSFYTPSKQNKGLLMTLVLAGVVVASLLFFWLDPMSQGLQ
ncbi:MAG: helix-turn-helix domain-containing protein [Desulfobacterales bacterium]|nr:helix-turn-helix domain-containing protein [Desulfobacterales bacterium]